MAEVTIILSLSKVHGADANVVKRTPGQNNLLGPHVAVPAEIPEGIWNQLVTGDELDTLVQVAVEIGRKLERGEYDSIIH